MAVKHGLANYGRSSDQVGIKISIPFLRSQSPVVFCIAVETSAMGEKFPLAQLRVFAVIKDETLLTT